MLEVSDVFAKATDRDNMFLFTSDGSGKLRKNIKCFFVLMMVQHSNIRAIKH